MEISKNRYSDIDKYLIGFPYGLLQDFITFIDYIGKREISQDEVRAYLAEHRRRLTEGGEDPRIESAQGAGDVGKRMPRCPICKLPLRIEAVNNNSRRMIGGTARCWWICPDIQCEHEPILSDLGPKEELERVGVMGVSHHMRKAARRKAIAADRRQKRGKYGRL